jgi:hypothetical protein
MSNRAFTTAALAAVVVAGLAAQAPLKSGLDPATFDKPSARRTICSAT